jgi:hypothetical protein
VREIQSRIRAGQTAEQVAAEAGVAVENVRRYEGPVLAEREHVVSRARAAVLGPDGAPTLDDLVADRLATRGCDATDAQWDSARDDHGAWHVYVEFTAGGSSRVATWAYDVASRSIEALDDEARWLSENDVESDPVRRDLTGGASAGALDAVVRPVLAAVDDRSASPEDRATDVLLDDLEKRRGRRGAQSPVREPSGPRVHEPTGAREVDPAHAAPATDVPDAAVTTDQPASPVHLIALPKPEESAGSAGVEPADAPESGAAPQQKNSEPARGAQAPAPQAVGAAQGGNDRHARRGGRRSRTKIPSWDEIMFGNKPEK